MNVQGSNQQAVRYHGGVATWLNVADGSSIPFTRLLRRATVMLTNRDAPGTDFNIGGSIAIPSTADGSTHGTVQVTVDYQ
jgi:hypothetical protein